MRRLRELREAAARSAAGGAVDDDDDASGGDNFDWGNANIGDGSFIEVTSRWWRGLARRLTAVNDE